jgi:hypothetical protein
MLKQRLVLWPAGLALVAASFLVATGLNTEPTEAQEVSTECLAVAGGISVIAGAAAVINPTIAPYMAGIVATMATTCLANATSGAPGTVDESGGGYGGGGGGAW